MNIAKLSPLLISVCCSKSYNFDPHKLCNYWTNVTKFIQNVDKSLPVNHFKSEMQSSKPFQNTGVMNEGAYADFADLTIKLVAIVMSIERW